MINLTIDLPTAIEVNGRFFPIKTDFREWLKFSQLITKKDLLYDDLFYLFENEIPNEPFFEALLKFYINENTTPRGNGADEKTFDYYEDGEYIYSAFMQQYHIDLIESNLHWHKFKALFICITDDTKMGYIMSKRSYRKNNKKPEQIYQEEKTNWSLIPDIDEEDLAIFEEFNKL